MKLYGDHVNKLLDVENVRGGTTYRPEQRLDILFVLGFRVYSQRYGCHDHPFPL